MPTCIDKQKEFKLSINNQVFMMQTDASQLLIAGNDEHGLLPQPTPGKRTPIMPRVNRSFYENEFNRMAKQYFLEACKRCGFRTLDVKPENTDVSLTTRANRVRNSGASALVTFAYNAVGDGNSFNSTSGFEVLYSRLSPVQAQSRVLAQNIVNFLAQGTQQNNRGIKTDNFYMLYAVPCPSVIVEAGFMTNLREARFMLDPDFQQEVGEECCQGVCAYFGVKYIAPQARVLSTIRQGSRGALVRYAQEKLYSKLYPGVGAIDGVFGSKTAQAVRDFQRENGLVVDGIIGPRTWAVLSSIEGGKS